MVIKAKDTGIYHRLSNVKPMPPLTRQDAYQEPVQLMPMYAQTKRCIGP
jgi:hypothetical protein